MEAYDGYYIAVFGCIFILIYALLPIAVFIGIRYLMHRHRHIPFPKAPQLLKVLKINLLLITLVAIAIIMVLSFLN